MIIKPNPSADQRTRNRIREHGPEFTLIDGPKPVFCFNGAVAILVEAGEWRGWLKTKMITIEGETV